jgi:hypothetical protein
MAAAFAQLARMAPAINHEVAWFLPKNFAAAVSGVALESVVGKVVGWLAGRSAGSTIAEGGEDVVTLYHQGNLADGRVLPTKSLSTSTSPDLAHYHPGEALQVFKVPIKTLLGWEKAGYVTRYTDMYDGIITSEIRIEAGASGEMNKYLLKN